MRRTVWLLLASVAVVGILMLFVFPTRTLLEQDHQISTTEHQIAVLDKENATLRRRAASLDNPAALEQLARREYGLVMPGQKAYDVVPASKGGR